MKKPTLVLDLDETLLHTDLPGSEGAAAFKRKPDYRVPSTGLVGWLRPHLEPFLDYAFENFDVIVWTAGSGDYADVVVPAAFGDREPRQVLCLDDCVARLDNVGWHKYSKFNSKPLPKLWLRGCSSKRTLIVDDRADTASYNINNLALIPAFVRDDQYLLKLRNWLHAQHVPQLKDLAALDKTTWWLE